MTPAGAASGRTAAIGAGLDAVGREGLCLALHRLGLPDAGSLGSPDALAARLGIAPQHRRLFPALLGIAERAGRLTGLATGALTVRPRAAPDPAEAARRLVSAYPEVAPQVALLTTCLDALPDVLTGRRNAVEVLFPGGSMELVAAAYRDNPVAAYYNGRIAGLVRDYVALRLSDAPDARVTILEVGAGTGGTSAGVLDALDPAGEAVRYLYTDLSPGFLHEAEGRFGGPGRPWISFRPFDLERDPEAQGFAAESVDVVIAANVLHAVRRIDDTLARLKRVMRPGVILLASEATRLTEFATLTFGLTEGWWRFEDATRRLPDGPLLSAAGWRDVLGDVGFRDIAARTRNGDGWHLVAAESDGRRVPSRTPEAGTPARPPAPRGAAPSSAGDGAMLDFVRQVFAEVLKMPLARLDPRAPFEEFGIDSLVTVQLTRRLEETLGRLPASLLFEASTIERLAGRLQNEHGRRLPEAVPAADLTPSEPVIDTPPPPRAVAAPAFEPRRNEQVSEAPIAIVGLAGRYPGAADLDAFWDALVAGRSAVREIPAERWPAPAAGGARYGAFLDDVDRFDPLFFRISPREAEAMDPQERLFLTTAWHALEDAGLTRRGLAEAPVGGEVGVFAGVMNSGYEWLGGAASAAGIATGAHAAHWSIANRVSYVFDFTGPSMAVDTACSSSLSAIHLAVESLRRGECRVALAGGVNLILAPVQMERLERLGMLAPDGVCRPFGDGAAGMVDGEGVGVAVLRPLAEAQAAGDRILAVIRGSAVNAGGRTAGYTVPNPLAQAAVVRRALARAGDIDPATITYVEAHGTGTPLGDPVEIAGLAEVWRASDTGAATCRVGSVKGNIGHLESAAGIAGLTKIVLQMRHGTIAPSLNAETPNPGLDLAATPFRIATGAGEWTAGDTPLRAGLSSFGAGGANAHAVIEAAPSAARDAESDPGPVALVLSAHEPDRLSALRDRLAAYLGTEAGRRVPLADIAHTLQVGREAMEHRFGAVVATYAEAIAALRETAGETPLPAAPGPLATLVDAWRGGGAVDWPAIPSAQRVGLPLYPFAGERYFVPLAEPVPAPTAPDPLLDAPADEARRWLTGLVADVSGVAVERLREDRTFDTFGIDSVLMMELIGRMETRLGPLPATLLFEHPTLAGLTAHVAERHGDAFAAADVRPAGPPVPLAAPAVMRPGAGNDPAAPIAVIGLGLYAPGPGADGVVRVDEAAFTEGWSALDAFARALEAGHDAVTEIPADRWDWRDPVFFAETRAAALATGRSYARWGGFLDGGIDRFDAQFFGISPREAELMDPQERLFLEVAWHTVEDAGFARDALRGAKVGVFAGAMFGHYQLHEAASGIANSSFASIANRVSHVFDWRGPSLAVDTMCSSSLTAIALACASLRRGESTMALAGGVNLITHPRRFALLSQGGFAASDGRCHAFGEGGDGYVPGEGAGAVLLKPLAEALADGDPIRAVIRGVAANHGGQAGGAFTAPSPAAQAEAIAAARAEAGGGDVDYVEAHGTGTALGDPVELAGLARGYGTGTERRTIALGSVKSNIGHLEAAAGIAALAKVILGLERRTLVPSLPHSDRLNPHCDFASAGFALQRTCAPWPAGEGPRRAGISAFGAGGSNVHLVVEEAPAAAAYAGAAGDAVLVPLSAPSEAQLRATAAALAAWLEPMTAAGPAPDRITAIAAEVLGITSDALDPDDTLADCGFDALTRATLADRLAASLGSASAPRPHLSSEMRLRDLAGLLGTASGREASAGAAPHDHATLAAIAATLSAGREAFETRAAFVVSSLAGLAEGMRRLAATGERPSAAGPAGDLHAVARRWVAGEALPETATGGARARRLNLPGLAFRRPRHWLRPRKDSPRTGHPLIGANRSGWDGAEVALRLGEAAFLRDHVVRGTAILPAGALAEIVAAAAERLGAPQIAALDRVVWHRPLRVDVPAALRLVREGDGARVMLLAGDVLAAEATAVFAAPAGASAAIESVRARCATALDPARLYAEMAARGLVYGEAFRVIDELLVGTGEAMARLRRPPAAPAGFGWHPALVDGALQATVTLLAADDGAALPSAAERIVLSAPLPDTCLVHVRRRSVPPGQAPRFDIAIVGDDGRPLMRIDGLELGRGDRPDRPRVAPEPDGVLFLEPCWIAAPPASDRAAGPVLLLDAPAAMVGAIAAAFGTGAAPLTATGADPATIKRALRTLPQGSVRALSWSAGGDPLAGPLALCRAMLAMRPGEALDLVHAVDGLGAEAAPRAVAVAGFARSIRLEAPHLAVRTLRLPAAAAHAEAARALLAELAAPSGASELRLGDGGRQTRRLAPVMPPAPSAWLSRGAVTLITGGAGGVGALVAAHLARRFGAALALTGRSPQDGRITALLQRLEAEGAAKAIYVEADIAAAGEADQVATTVRQRLGPINAVLHAAGITRDALLPAKSPADFAAVLAPKISGAEALDAATVADPLEAFVLFSSLAAELGNQGQTDYAYANAALDAFAATREARRERGERQGLTRSIGWPLWAEGAMRPPPAVVARLKAELGLAPLATSDALDALDRAMAHPAPRLVVLSGDTARLAVRIAVAPADMKAAPPAPVAQPVADPGALADVADAVLAAVAEALYIPRGELRADTALTSYGLGSMAVAEVAAALEPRFGPLPLALFVENPTAEAIAAAILAGSDPPASADAASRTASVPLTAESPAVSSTPQRSAPRPAGTDEPIAIIGAAGRYPGAADLVAFWDNIAAGRDAIGPPPAGRWPEGGPAVRGGFLEGVAGFDPLFFAISPREAEILDPEVRLFLETAWQAFEDAGFTRPALAALQDEEGGAVGVYVASMYRHYPLLADTMERAAQLASSGPWMIANRTSHALDLRGPSHALDAACAGALSAIHDACAALRRGDCALALAGGVNLTLAPGKYAALGGLGLLESGAESRPLGAGTGMMPGEGVGAVVLRPLAAAEAAGDRMLGVILGSAVNHSGRREGRAFNVPSAAAQAAVIGAALGRAGVPAGTITALELAANGSPLGDAAEIAATVEAFRAAGDTRTGGECAVGSVKSGIGHLEAASGVAGLGKLLGAFHRGALAPTLNSTPSNPALDFRGTPFAVHTAPSSWEAPTGTPRRAGLASFGAGGSNSFLVLEEPAAASPTPGRTGCRPLPPLRTRRGRARRRRRPPRGGPHRIAHRHPACRHRLHAADGAGAARAPACDPCGGP